MIIWVGASLAGLIGLANTATFNNAPALFRGLEATAIIVGAAFFAVARVKFEWEATQIKRGVEDGDIWPTQVAPEEWPEDAEACWFSLRFCVIAGGVIMLVCFWWEVGAWLVAHSR